MFLLGIGSIRPESLSCILKQSMKLAAIGFQCEFFHSYLIIKCFKQLYIPKIDVSPATKLIWIILDSQVRENSKCVKTNQQEKKNSSEK